MKPVAIDGARRDYAWGSRTAIQRMLAVPEDGGRIAELWFGAHPQEPSPVPERGGCLDELIAADPGAMLGRDTVERFGPNLPYLVKILAAEQALSIQVHPTREQARVGYERENRLGIPAGAPDRNYRDANHKPELLCALTPFDALCGFRPVEQTLALLTELAVPELAFVVDLLHGDDPLRAAFTALLAHEDPVSLASAVAQRAAEADDGPLRAARLAADDAPGDIGVVLGLLLNYVRLEPGEAIYLGPGNVHGYLRGTGVEIMASSDNVLRCGLTGKHLDVPELLQVTDFAPLAEPRWPSAGGRFEVPVPDFALTRLEVDDPTALDEHGPCIVVCTSGRLAVSDVPVPAGHGAFVPAGLRSMISGAGQAFVATVGR